LAFVTVSATRVPLVSLTSSTMAPGMTPPCSSRTVPATVAVVTCDRATGGPISKPPATSRIVSALADSRCCLIFPPLPIPANLPARWNRSKPDIAESHDGHGPTIGNVVLEHEWPAHLSRCRFTSIVSDARHDAVVYEHPVVKHGDVAGTDEPPVVAGGSA